MYEDGDALVPGISKQELPEYPYVKIIETYDVSILNGYLPAFERMAELYRLGGPPRYRGKNWNPLREDAMFMSKFQYGECLKADPANLVCARGLRETYASTAKTLDYTNHDPAMAAYYDDYVRKLEELLAKR